MMKLVLKPLFTVFSLCIATCVFSQVDVLTQHNNLSRTGWNDAESILKISNVNGSSFGLLTSHSVDDQIYAQPLVVSGVNIGGNSTNVVYVATVNNTVYAFNADDGAAPILWQRNLLTNPSHRTVYNTDMIAACSGSYNDFRGVDGLSAHGDMGIVGTPVIDKASNTMYLVHREADPAVIDNAPGKAGSVYKDAGFTQWLHAIDIRTGAEKSGSPVQITATAAGTAPGNVAGQLHFDSRRENQRCGLLLLNGVVYIPYAAHCDWDPYLGWVLGYDGGTLQQKTAYVTGPKDGRGGIWMSGGAIAADPAANNGNGTLYVASGNSYNADPSVLENRGESIIRLDPNSANAGSLTKLNIGDYFTPTDYMSLNAQDLDFGTQTMLLPNSNLLVAGCKDHNLYVFNKLNLGKFSTVANQNLQKIYVSDNAQMHTAFAYFGGANHKYFYQFSENSNLKAYPVTPNALGAAISGVAKGPSGAAGALLSTSSNGSDESTGILWISQPKPGCNANQGPCSGILRAVDAVNINTEIWNSATSGTDDVGVFSKNSPPTVANGKVYLPTLSNKLDVYGLLASNPLCKTNVALAKAYTDNNNDAANAGLAFDGSTAAGSSWQGATNDAWLQVDLGASYDICKIALTWQGADNAGSAFKIQVSGNAAGPWTTIENITGNTTVTSDYSGTYPASRFVRLQGVTPGISGNYQLAEMAVMGTPASTCAVPANPGANPVSQTDATITWDPVATATSYNLRYQPSGTSSWINRTTTTNSEVLSQLSCGFDYSVEVQAVCPTGNSAFASVSPSTAVCTTPCTLPTRYGHTDLGDIGVGGSSCYGFDGTDSIFTIKGSGAIAGNDDKFQFAYTNLAGDETFSMEVVSQPALPGNQAGIMMRDSLSNISRFAYAAITQGAGAQFMYRTTPGGPVTTVQGPVISAPYYLQLKKVGSTYTASVSTNGNTFTEFASKDVGFGLNTVYPGLAVSSGDNTKLSTATFKNFQESSPLPVSLLDFSGKNIYNQYVLLSWTTSMEKNNDHFLLEHSPDGVHFTTLTTIKSKADSDTVRKYSIIDNSPFNGANYYRLKQVDIDGKTTTLPTIQVNFGSGQSPAVYPNPATDFVTVVAADEPIQSVILYDLLGKQLLRKDNIDGSTQVKMNLSGLPSAVYLVKTITAGRTYQQKLVKR